MIIPTLVDPTMAPPGKHVISCFVQYAPYKLAPELGTWDDQREAFGDAVIDRIAEFAPNIRDIILFRNVQTPLDIERTTGLTEGNIFQGELTLEQLFFNRPVPGLRPLQDADPRPLAVRLVDPSGRRDHGRERPDRGARGAPVARPESRLMAPSPRAADRPPSVGRGDGGAGQPALRRDRRRGRPQRPRHGGVSREGRPAGRSSSSGAATSEARPRPGSWAVSGCRAWPIRSGASVRRSSRTST